MAKKDGKEQYLYQSLATKDVYYYKDIDKNIDQKCREVYKNKDEEVHYPIGYDGGPKYKNAEKFIYKGFKGKLPVGIVKSPSRGFGFTKVLKPLMLYIEENLTVNVVVIIKNGKSEISIGKKQLCFNEVDLIKLHSIFQNMLDKHKQENERIAIEQLNLLFPDQIKKKKKRYIKNSLSSALSTWGQSISEFSDKDKDSVKELFDKLSLTDGFFDTKGLLKTKASVDIKYFDSVITKYRKLMAQKTETQTLEKEWQTFLNEYSWIFSYIFSFPIIMFQKEAYVGGKNISNKNGKVTDFIVKNKLTDNVAFIEIKTHKTELIKKGKTYRGNDVYCMSSDLSGGIAQVLNQRDNFQKHFATIKMASEDDFEAYNSKCVVLMGSYSELDKKMLSSFELFRSNSKDVEILTFDELLERITHLKELVSGNRKIKQTGK